MELKKFLQFNQTKIRAQERESLLSKFNSVEQEFMARTTPAEPEAPVMEAAAAVEAAVAVEAVAVTEPEPEVTVMEAAPVQEVEETPPPFEAKENPFIEEQRERKKPFFKRPVRFRQKVTAQDWEVYFLKKFSFAGIRVITVDSEKKDNEFTFSIILKSTDADAKKNIQTILGQLQKEFDQKIRIKLHARRSEPSDFKVEIALDVSDVKRDRPEPLSI